MEKREVRPLAEYFKDVEDPRIERTKFYPLIEVIIITLLAFMSGASETQFSRAGKTSKRTGRAKSGGCGSFSLWSTGYRGTTCTGGSSRG